MPSSWKSPIPSDLKSLAIGGSLDYLQNLARHLNLPAPSLRELTIDFNCKTAPVFDNVLLKGNLSSVHTLNLGGVITCLPWKNLQNLTTFKLRCAPGKRVNIMRFLNFLENAPQLGDITLHPDLIRRSPLTSGAHSPFEKLHYQWGLGIRHPTLIIYLSQKVHHYPGVPLQRQQFPASRLPTKVRRGSQKHLSCYHAQSLL